MSRVFAFNQKSTAEALDRFVAMGHIHPVGESSQAGRDPVWPATRIWMAIVKTEITAATGGDISLIPGDKYTVGTGEVYLLQYEDGALVPFTELVSPPDVTWVTRTVYSTYPFPIPVDEGAPLPVIQDRKGDLWVLYSLEGEPGPPGPEGPPGTPGTGGTTPTGVQFSKNLVYMGSNANVAESQTVRFPVGFANPSYNWLQLTNAGWAVSEDDETLVCEIGGMYEVHVQTFLWSRNLRVGQLELWRQGETPPLAVWRAIPGDVEQVSDNFTLAGQLWVPFEVGDKIYAAFYNRGNRTGGQFGNPRIQSYTISLHWLDALPELEYTFEPLYEVDLDHVYPAPLAMSHSVRPVSVLNEVVAPPPPDP